MRDRERARRTGICQMRLTKRQTHRFGGRIIDRIFAVTSERKNLTVEAKCDFYSETRTCQRMYANIHTRSRVDIDLQSHVVSRGNLARGNREDFLFQACVRDFTALKELTRGLLGSYLSRTHKIGLSKWLYFKRNPPRP